MDEPLRTIAERVDATIAASRAELVRAVRQAYASGMTQSEIAGQIGRSQPEVNRLLHFHGSSPRARALRAHAPQIRARIRAAGGRKVRLFGSTASGKDTPDSDIDLLFEMRNPLSLMELSAIERELSKLVGYRVDLVPESSVRPDLRGRILAEAVPL